MPIGPRDSRQEDSLTTLFRLGDSLTDGEGEIFSTTVGVHPSAVQHLPGEK